MTGRVGARNFQMEQGCASTIVELKTVRQNGGERGAVRAATPARCCQKKLSELSAIRPLVKSQCPAVPSLAAHPDQLMQTCRMSDITGTSQMPNNRIRSLNSLGPRRL